MRTRGIIQSCAILALLLCAISNASADANLYKGQPFYVGHRTGSNDPIYNNITDTSAPIPSAVTANIIFDDNGEQVAALVLDDVIEHMNKTDVITFTGSYKIPSDFPASSYSVMLYDNRWTRHVSTIDTVVFIKDGNWHNFTTHIIATEDYSRPTIILFYTDYITYNGTITVNGFNVTQTDIRTKYSSIMTKNETIVCIGDSLTAGNICNGGFPAILAAELPGWTVINSGIDGNTPAMILARWKKDVSAHNPDYVVILAGTNSNWDINGTEANLKTMYNLSINEGITPIVCTLPPIPNSKSNVSAINTWIRSYTGQHKYALIDFYNVLNSSSDSGNFSDYYYYDGLHPNCAGYAAMGVSIDLNVFTTSHMLRVPHLLRVPYRSSRIQNQTFQL